MTAASLLHRRRNDELRRRLALMRPMTSLIDREILSRSAAFQFDSANWVRMWLDPGHVVASDCGAATAWRGISYDGRLLWLVRHRDKRHGYHSEAACPFDAIAEAEHAWAERRRVRALWPQVEALARDLRRGRKRFEVRLEDAHASALCAVGIESFLRRVGLGRATALPGRAAAMLMRIEPQVGFVILAAYERQFGRLSPDNRR
jgi:hypothetical protein